MGKKKPRPTPIPPEPLGSLFDAHTHLWSCGARTLDEVRAIMDRAVATGVGTVCNVGDGIEETRQAVAATQWDERVVAAVAIHPTKSQQLTEEVRAELTELARHKRVVAIGECGLDWYWLDKDDSTADKDTQIEALHWHIELAKTLGKPLGPITRQHYGPYLAATGVVFATALRHVIRHWQRPKRPGRP